MSEAIGVYIYIDGSSVLSDNKMSWATACFYVDIGLRHNLAFNTGGIISMDPLAADFHGADINTSFGGSIIFMIPMYLYGIHVNRLNEETFNHYMYNWQYWDKRNRLCHNMIMEHFEVHKE